MPTTWLPAPFSPNRKVWLTAHSRGPCRVGPLLSARFKFKVSSKWLRINDPRRILKGLDKPWVNPPQGGEGKALLRVAREPPVLSIPDF